MLKDDQNTNNDTLTGTWTGIEEKVNRPLSDFTISPTLGHEFYVTSSLPVTFYGADGRIAGRVEGNGKFAPNVSGIYFGKQDKGNDVKKIVKVE